MNNKSDRFDDLAKGLAQSVARRQAVKRFGVGLALVCLLRSPAVAQIALGSPVEISFPNPLAGCDDGFNTGGTWTIQDAAEPFIAVNPVNPKNIVAAWIGGLNLNTITAASFDGGATWQRTALPLTVCAGGAYLAAGDPWLSFAPNGDLYVSSIAGDWFTAKVLGVCKSTDGGLHWSAPVIISTQNADKSSITADPHDSRFVYVTWDQGSPVNIGFSRSTDGGETWEPLQGISNTHLAGVSQILVLPDGTLVNLAVQTSKDILQVARSTDRGQTWSMPASAFTMVPVAVFDPNLRQAIRAPVDVPSYAVDSQSGNLYVVWMDGRFSNLQYTDIAFSMSADGGVNWSSPIRVNQTPLNIPAGNRQAFVPVIAVAANGTIGVSYYDFRFNGAGPALLTDRWLIECQASAATPPTNPANWGGEVRLTANSFDLEMAVNWFGLFLGDYEGLATFGDSFLAAFAAVDQNGATGIFTRRVRP